MSMTFDDTTQPTDQGWNTSSDTKTPMRLGTVCAVAGHAPLFDDSEIRMWMLFHALKRPHVIDAWWEGDLLYVDMYLQGNMRTPSVIGEIKPIKAEKIIIALEEVKRLEADDPEWSGIGGQS